MCMHGAPGMKAVRILLTIAALRKHLAGVYDITAAFIHAAVEELIIVCPGAGSGLVPAGYGLLLLKALYGTRRASKSWQNFYTNVLCENGWTRSKVFAACFFRPQSKTDEGATLLVHGDDILLEGDQATHDETDELLKKNMNVKILHKLGPGKPGEGKFLKRTLSYDHELPGFTLEGDHRHVYEAAVAVGLMERGGFPSKGSETPGSKAVGAGPDSDEKLDEEQAASYRRAAGILMYIILDRPDAQYSGE